MQTKKEYREEFLQKYGTEIQNANMDKIAYLIEKAVKTNKPQILDYKNIVSIGAAKKGEKVDANQLAFLLENIFEYWIKNNIKIRLKTAQSDWQKQEYEKLIEDFDFYKKNKKEFDIFDFWSYYGEKWIDGKKSPIYFQGKHFCHFYTNMLSTDRFDFEKQWYDAKIYLNIKVQNTPKLAKIFIDKAIQKNIPLTFKFGFCDDRNDNFVLYSEYKHINSLIDMIEETKKENPKLFVGCKVKNPLMSTLKGYMGFGEEPVTWGSYKSVRVDILEGTYRTLAKLYKNDKGCLTKDNIISVFNDECKRNYVDSQKFYLNQKEQHFNYDK